MWTVTNDSEMWRTDAYIVLLWPVLTQISVYVHILSGFSCRRQTVNNTNSSLTEFWCEIFLFKEIKSYATFWPWRISFSFPTQRELSREDICGEAANTSCTCHRISNGGWLGLSEPWLPPDWMRHLSHCCNKPTDHHAHGPKRLSISSCPLALVQTHKPSGPGTAVTLSVSSSPWKRDQAWARCLLLSLISTWTNYQLIN